MDLNSDLRSDISESNWSTSELNWVLIWVTAGAAISITFSARSASSSKDWDPPPSPAPQTQPPANLCWYHDSFGDDAKKCQPEKLQKLVHMDLIWDRDLHCYRQQFRHWQPNSGSCSRSYQRSLESLGETWHRGHNIAMLIAHLSEHDVLQVNLGMQTKKVCYSQHYYQRKQLS